MRFLIDNMLSVHLVDALTSDGHDAVHVRTLGLAAAPDGQLLGLAKTDDRVVLSADRDFGTLLAELGSTQPSVIYLRGGVERHPDRLATLIRANLPVIEPLITEGAIIVIEPGRIRYRRLPIE